MSSTTKTDMVADDDRPRSFSETEKSRKKSRLDTLNSDFIKPRSSSFESNPFHAVEGTWIVLPPPSPRPTQDNLPLIAPDTPLSNSFITNSENMRVSEEDSYEAKVGTASEQERQHEFGVSQSVQHQDLSEVKDSDKITVNGSHSILNVESFSEEGEPEKNKSAYYGAGSCHPSSLQWCTSVTSFTCMFSFCTVLVSCLNAYLPSQIPSIEKEFGIDSTTSGMLVSAIQIGYLSTCLILGHLCKQTHIPRFLAWTVFLFGLAGLIPAFAELAVHPSLPSSSSASMSSARYRRSVPLERVSLGSMQSLFMNQSELYLNLSSTSSFPDMVMSPQHFFHFVPTNRTNKYHSKRSVSSAIANKVVSSRRSSPSSPLPIDSSRTSSSHLERASWTSSSSSSFSESASNPTSHPEITVKSDNFLCLRKNNTKLNTSLSNAAEQESTTSGPDPEQTTSGSSVDSQEVEYLAPGRKNMWLVYLLGICSLIMGAVRSAEVSLPTHYIDNNVDDRAKTGMLAGIIMTALLFGQPIALLIGSFTSRIPLDLSETTLTTEDSRWIGAWWLGFLILGVACIVSSLPVCFYPRAFKLKKDMEDEEVLPMKELLKDFPRALWRLCKNPVVMFIAASFTFASMAALGYTSFASKYITNQFNLSLSKANVSLGTSGVLTALLGTFLGGLLSTRLHLGVIGNLRLGVANSILGVIAQLLNLYFGCHNQSIIGHGNTNSEAFDPYVDCSCQSSQVLLSCGTNGQSYLSPCFAGCVNVTDSTYGGCSQINASTVQPGLCDTGCGFFYPYMVMSALSDIAVAQSMLPLYVASIRSVEERDKTMTVALLTFVMTLGGFLPGPIIFGRLVDHACALWSGSEGHQGSCQIYDLDLLRHSVKGADLGLKALTAISVITALVLAVLKARKTQDPKLTPDDAPMMESNLSRNKLNGFNGQTANWGKTTGQEGVDEKQASADSTNEANSETMTTKL